MITLSEYEIKKLKITEYKLEKSEIIEESVVLEELLSFKPQSNFLLEIIKK
jgi:hypothetical protein